MELTHACQIQATELSTQQFDLVILANKHSARSPFLLANYNIKARRTLILLDAEESKENKILNPGFQNLAALDLLEVSPSDGSRIIEYIESITESLKLKDYSILVDYSCMTKYWYASIINYFYLNETSCENINIYFAYVPISYIEPRKQGFDREMNVVLKNPVNGNHGISEKALILGLGYDEERSDFIIQKIKPKEIYLFYSQPAFDEQYTEKVLSLNDKLIHSYHAGNLIPYPLPDMDATIEILTKTVLDLRLKYQVVLASFGPKLLTLACLLLFARFPDIEIITAGNDTHTPSGARPINKPVIYKAVFLSDEQCE